MESAEPPSQSKAFGETRDWRALPDDVIRFITKFFNSLVDFYSFRNTCPSWRSVAIPSSQTLLSQSPILFLPVETFEFEAIAEEEFIEVPKDTKEAFIDVASRKIYKVPPFLSWSNRPLLNFSHGYLATGDDDGIIHLRHIFTRDEFRLPKTTRDLKEGNIIFSDKPSSPECVFLLFHHYYNTYEFCIRGDRCWNAFEIDDFVFMDMVFFEGRLYALLTKRGSFGTQWLAIFDLFPQPKTCFMYELHNFNDQSFLVSSSNELLIYSGKKYYRWVTETKRGIRAKSCSRKAKFVTGTQPTVSIDPSSLHGIEPDFRYCYDMYNDILFGFSEVNRSGWEFRVDFSNFISESVGQSGRPVWVFPSLCF